MPRLPGAMVSSMLEYAGRPALGSSPWGISVMELQHLTCRDFRCFEQVDFHPQPGMNVILGANAVGKTSLLEAILFLATSKSHRTGTESDLVRHGTPGFRLEAAVRRRDREVHLETTWWEGAKRVKVNSVAQTRVSDLLGKANVVFFSPEDTAMVRGAASERRRFLDMALSQVDATYLNALQRYRQVLRQRNELLRQPRRDPGFLDAWDEQLAAYAAPIAKGRAAFLERLGHRAAEAYACIADGEAFEVAYRPSASSEHGLRETLRRRRDSDLKHGTTSTGPHRDDIDFSIAGRSARVFASQGQQRTATLAVKLAELDLARERVGEYPILLLDEVFSELDRRRAERLLERVQGGPQCLITTAGRSKDELSVGGSYTRFRLAGGVLEED